MLCLLGPEGLIGSVVDSVCGRSSVDFGYVVVRWMEIADRSVDVMRFVCRMDVLVWWYCMWRECFSLVMSRDGFSVEL